MQRNPVMNDKVIFVPGHGKPDVAGRITMIWSNSCVNLVCEDGSAPTSVFLRQSYDPQRPSGYYCEFEPVEQEVEDAAPPAPTLSFSDALVHLKHGYKAARQGWNGKGLWIELQRPDEGSKMTLPYLYLSYSPQAATLPGARVPWLASQTDLLAEDWVLVS